MNAGEYTTSTHFLLHVSCELIKTESNDYGHLKIGELISKGSKLCSSSEISFQKNNIFFIFPPHLF